MMNSRKRSRMKHKHFLIMALSLLCISGCKKDGDGPGVAEKPYAIQVTPPAEGKIGSPLTARVRMEPRGKYKVNLEYPAKLEVMGPMGAAPMRQTIAKGDASALTERELIMDASFVIGKGGEHKFSGKLNFSVCTDALCELKSEDVTWTVKIAE